MRRLLRRLSLAAALALHTGCADRPRTDEVHSPAPAAQSAAPAAPILSASAAPAAADSAPALDSAAPAASTTDDTPPPPTATASAAPVSSAPRAQVTCYCFDWVHLDENGHFCYPTRAGCQERFRTFGRHDKLPCAPSREPRCDRIACQGSGARCFRE